MHEILRTAGIEDSLNGLGVIVTTAPDSQAY